MLGLPRHFYLSLCQHITLLNPNHHLTGHHADRQRLPGQAALRQPVLWQRQLAVIPYLVHSNIMIFNMVKVVKLGQLISSMYQNGNKTLDDFFRNI
ncbi:hypothetical protein ACQ4OC_18540 [Yersinia sp. J1]|uniref:hypothetical protein n=1 Tax=Yersinia sp. J1 TaxID=3424774 RepID=UPI003D35A441